VYTHAWNAALIAVSTISAAPHAGSLSTNRRKARGAELYDLFMVLRFDRERAKLLRIFQAMCRMASNWRAEDRARRAGRRSYRRPEDVLATRPHLRAIVSYDRTGRRGAR